MPLSDNARKALEIACPQKRDGATDGAEIAESIERAQQTAEEALAASEDSGPAASPIVFQTVDPDVNWLDSDEYDTGSSYDFPGSTVVGQSFTLSEETTFNEIAYIAGKFAAYTSEAVQMRIYDFTGNEIGDELARSASYPISIQSNDDNNALHKAPIRSLIGPTKTLAPGKYIALFQPVIGTPSALNRVDIRVKLGPDAYLDGEIYDVDPSNFTLAPWGDGSVVIMALRYSP